MTFQELINRAIEVQHHLHANPELSFEEWATCSFIENELKSYGITSQRVANTGLIAVIEGQRLNSDKQDILLRADIDALPIIEESGLSYSSTNGAMHACGHDIHTAVLLGVIVWLHNNRNLFSGRVIALFQPGEECSPGGASLVLASGVLNQFNIKAAYALHTAHDMAVGSFGIREGEYMASTTELRIEIVGRGGHAALTPANDNTISDIANIIAAVRELSEESTTSLVAIGHIEAMGSTNIIPEKGAIKGTLRAMSIEQREILKNRVIEVVKRLSPLSRVTFTDGYPPIYNDLALTSRVISIFSKKFGSDKIYILPIRMTSDDFSNFSMLYPSVYYRLGVMPDGNNEVALPHTSRFYADSKAIEFGISSLLELVAGNV